MYVDESGVENVVSDARRKNFDSDWFTTGGIIVKEENIGKFEWVLDSIVRDNFTNRGMKLPSDFKLHYNSLRAKEYPYDRLSDLGCKSIADAVFESINSIECSLVSATIHKPSHLAKYEIPVDVRAYTLLICMERFQYFLQDVNGTGAVVYEQLTVRLRQKMYREMRALRAIPNFPYLTKLDKIRGKIINGDPTRDKMLQFADFFAYAPHIKMVTCHKKDTRWQEIKNRYYSPYGDWKKRGFVVL